MRNASVVYLPKSIVPTALYEDDHFHGVIINNVLPQTDQVSGNWEGICQVLVLLMWFEHTSGKLYN